MNNVFSNVHRGKMIAFLFLAPLESLSSVGFALLLEPLTNSGLEGKMRELLMFSCFFLALGLVNVFLSYYLDKTKIMIETEYERNLRDKFIDAMYRQTMKSFYSNDQSYYLTKATTESEEITGYLCSSVLNIYRVIWSLVFTLGALLYIHWSITFVIVLLSFVSFTLPKCFQRKKERLEKEYLKISDKYIKSATESIRSFPIVKAYNVKTGIRSRYFETSKERSVLQGLKNIIDTKLAYLSMGITSMSFAVIVVLGSVLTAFGITSAGDILASSQLLGGIMVPFEQIPGYIMSFRLGKKMYNEYIEFEQESPEKELERIKPLGIKGDKLTVESVSLSFDNRVILNKVSFSLDTKKKYILVGESGAGKSCLAKLVSGQIDPDSGRITVDGLDMKTIPDRELFKIVSYQGQKPFLFNDTVRYNITLGRTVTNDQLDEIVKKARLSDFVSERENGIDYVVGDEGNLISGGEAQRVSIARSLVDKVRFVIYDESTAGLDKGNAEKIIDIILDDQETGALIITHDADEMLYKRVDGILMLQNGKIRGPFSYDAG